MKMHDCVIGSRTGLRMVIVGAGVLAVLVLACAGMVAGATWVVDDDGGADFTSIRAEVGAASEGGRLRSGAGVMFEDADWKLVTKEGNKYET